MTAARKVHLALIVLLGLMGEFVVLGFISTTAVRAADLSRAANAAIPPLGPPQGSLTLLTLSPVMVEGKSIGALAVYDDPATQRPQDYLELYDSNGELVAVGWFDRFGIQRVAVDRALIEGQEKLQGVFVTVVDGEPV